MRKSAFLGQWESEIAGAVAELDRRENVTCAIDTDQPRLLVESELLDVYRTYMPEEDCINLKHRLEVADIHG